MIIDLHSHSTRSDGRESVRTVFEEAKKAGVDVLALTDHDTTAGWAEAAEVANELGIRFIPGIEVTTRAHVIGRDGKLHKFGVHMLAYLPNPNHPELKQVLEESVLSRESRLREITERVAKDWHISWEEVEAQLSTGATKGRPALADALVAKGHFVNRGEVFDQVFFKNSPYYVPNRGVPDTIEAIRLIRRAGGVPVIAHPLGRGKGPKWYQPLPKAHFEEMIAAGLAGFEVYHRDVPERARRWLISLAKKHDLVITGSSDYHGKDGKVNLLGENTTSEAMLERIVSQGFRG